MSKRKFLSAMFAVTSLFSAMNFSHAIANPASIATEQEFVSKAEGDSEKLKSLMVWWFDSNKQGARSRTKQEAIEFAKKYRCDENKILEIWSRYHNEIGQNSVKENGNMKVQNSEEYLKLVEENSQLKRAVKEGKDLKKYIMDKISACDGTVWADEDYNIPSKALKDKIDSIFDFFAKNSKIESNKNFGEKSVSTSNISSVTAEKIDTYNNIFNL